MLRAACLPWPTPTVTVRSAGTMSPPAKIPAWPVIIRSSTFTTPSSTSRPGTPSSSDRSASWPSASTSESASSSSSLAGRLREAALVELHPLDHELARVGVLDRREPLHHHALLERLLDLEVVRRHALARAPVDDDRLARAEPLGGARGVHRGVAAAVDDDAPPEQRALLALHAAQQRDRVEDVRGLAGRDVGAFADVRADRQEGGVEAAVAHRVEDVRDLAVRARASTPRSRIRCISASSTSRGRRYLGMPKRIMPPAHRPGVADRHRVPAARQVVGGRQPRRAGADDQHALAARLGSAVELPALAGSPRRRGSARRS